jgi:inosine-uridine nucleoside N-ribohydrolase
VTNLAAAETKSPGILKKAKEIVIMGCAFFCSGNVTPHAKFNIWFNAEAEERQYLTAQGKIFTSFVEDWKQLFTTAELS